MVYLLLWIVDCSGSIWSCVGVYTTDSDETSDEDVDARDDDQDDEEEEEDEDQQNEKWVVKYKANNQTDTLFFYAFP